MSASAASSTLNFRHIFGVNSNVVDNVSFTDEDTIVYVAGHNLVLYSLSEKRQRFIQSAEIAETITCFTSGSGKRLAAVAERGDHPSFHIFDLRTFRRKKTITTSEIVSKEIVCLQFSEDNQLLLVQCGAPDWTLMCWNWAKSKLVASTTVSSPGCPIARCIFSPLDASVAVVIGKECVKFYRIGDKEMRPLHENFITGENFTACTWMRTPDDHMLVGTEEGKIMLFRSGELLSTLGCSPGPDHPIMSILSISGGFCVGSTDGTLLFFTYDESKDQALFDNQFQWVNTVAASDLANGHITTLAICPRDERLCCITSDGQILSLPAVSTNSIKVENVKYTVASFHSPKAITGMDVAVRKPTIITCSKDGSLRIWNFKTHELELSKIFPEEMFSVALHPTALHCAVGFTDKLRIFHILVDDLRLCLEVPIKSCRECRFAPGGNVLAAVNGNGISVFDFHTGEKLADLRGHNSKVRSLHWMPSGFQLLTCGQDGAVYMWSLDGAKRTGEFVHKGTVYTSVSTNNAGSVLVVGNDRSLRELTLPDLAPHKLHDAGLVLTNTCMSAAKSVLFASTYEYNKPGYVRVYPCPISGDFDDYACTNSQIVRLRLTDDDNFLVVADEQGCLLIMELRNRQDKFQRANPSQAPELLEVPDWSDEVLVTRAELEDCNTTVFELQTKVDELKLNNEYQLKLKEMNYSEKIKEATDKFVQELELAKSKLEMLQEVRVDYEIESIEKIKYMEEMHQNNIQNLETGFQAQIMEMVDSYQKLVKDRDGQIERLDEQRRQLVVSHERYVDQLTNDFNRKLDADRSARLQLEDERTELDKELNETQYQLEDDIDTEIENMKRTSEEKLALSRETTLKYKGENGIMKKKYVLLQRDIEDQKDEVKLLQSKEKDLHEQIKLLEKEVSAHKKEIKTRDASIGEKEKRIYELKKKNQELDKFKFVLDFKIRELKQQIEPRQMEIIAMRDKIKAMDSDLEKYHKSNTALDNLIGDLRTKIDEHQKETRDTVIQAKLQENTIASYRGGVAEAIKYIQSPPELMAAVKKLVETVGSLESVRPRVDPEVESEYSRHREFLRRSILELKKSLQGSSQGHMASNNKMRESNLALISQINSQREANRVLKMQVQADIGRIRHYANAPKKKTSSGSSAVGSNTSKGAAALTALPYINNADGSGGRATQTPANNEFIEPFELLEKNRRRILSLRAAISELGDRNSKNMSQRSYSNKELPPIDGGTPKLPAIEGGPASSPQEFGDSFVFGDSQVAMDGQQLEDNGAPAPAVPTYATEYKSPRDGEAD